MEASAKTPRHEPQKTLFVSLVVSLHTKLIAKELGRRYLPTPADRTRFLRDKELNGPIVFKMLVQRSSGTWLVFPPDEVQPTTTLSYVKELSSNKRHVSTLQIGLGHGAVCGSLVRTETIGVQKKVDTEIFFEFPFQAIDRFLTKVAAEDRLLPLSNPPAVITATLAEHGFEHVPLRASSEHVDSFGARWVSIDETAAAQDVWFGFGSRFAKIALNYAAFSSDVIPPFVAEMTSIHKTEVFDSEDFKKDVDSRVAFTGIAKKIDALGRATPYDPAA